MKVMKFGGTSVGSAQRMKDVAEIIINEGKNIIVLSAMSGTTNSLLEISDYLYKRNPDGANETINMLELKYFREIEELFESKEYKIQTLDVIKSHFDYIRSFTKKVFTLFEEKVIVAQGELLSTVIFSYYLKERGLNAILLPALEFMRINKNAEPDQNYIREHLTALLEEHKEAD
ncbi:MAG: aspartate kinase, partial [Bacteroidales bacterium]|nr:aspartate kinase [Bacteroidales bacterium]